MVMNVGQYTIYTYLLIHINFKIININKILTHRDSFSKVIEIELANFEVAIKRKIMIFPKTNIEEKLKNLKIKGSEKDRILEQVNQILKEDDSNQRRIEKNIVVNRNEVANNFDFELLETDDIYHINQIKHICVNYRLRFLASKYFKGEIPQEAIHKIKLLEKTHKIEVKGFKIIAPSRLFKLKDKNDPLLFAQIGNDYFYLIHK